LGAGEVDVDDGGDFGAVDAGVEPLDVVRAHAAGADDSYAKGFSHCFVPLVGLAEAGRFSQLTAVREPQESK
jgi:hypothetical protein